jgi:hypothetical protein
LTNHDSEIFELDDERWKLIYNIDDYYLRAFIASVKALKREGSVYCQISIRLVSLRPNSTVVSTKNSSHISLNPNKLNSVEWMETTLLNESKTDLGFTRFSPRASIRHYLHKDKCIHFLISAKVQDDPTLHDSNQSVPFKPTHISSPPDSIIDSQALSSTSRSVNTSTTVVSASLESATHDSAKNAGEPSDQNMVILGTQDVEKTSSLSLSTPVPSPSNYISMSSSHVSDSNNYDPPQSHPQNISRLSSSTISESIHTDSSSAHTDDRYVYFYNICHRLNIIRSKLNSIYDKLNFNPHLTIFHLLVSIEQ